MNTKNYLTPTKKYKTLISATHSVYRLVNSTYELKDLISRMSRLICQIFNANYCQIILLDQSKKYSLFYATVSIIISVFIIYGMISFNLIALTAPFVFSAWVTLALRRIIGSIRR